MSESVLPTAFDDIERALTALFRGARASQLYQVLSRQAGIELDRQGYIALVTLHETDAMRVSELAEACGVEISTASRLIARLQSAGLVEPAGAASDRRVVLLRLTDEGTRVICRVRAIRRERLAEMLAGWSGDERETFAHLLGRFAEGLEMLSREAIETTSETRR
jgi:DNA-binding MarR family transcriptional regulator